MEPVFRPLGSVPVSPTWQRGPGRPLPLLCGVLSLSRPPGQSRQRDGVACLAASSCSFSALDFPPTPVLEGSHLQLPFHFTPPAHPVRVPRVPHSYAFTLGSGHPSSTPSLTWGDLEQLPEFHPQVALPLEHPGRSSHPLGNHPGLKTPLKAAGQALFVHTAVAWLWADMTLK